MERVLAEVRGAAEGDALFVTGAGDCFCAGLNLKEVAAHDVPAMTKYLGTLEDLVSALYHHPGPVVAWLNGHAIAGGCVMALCCDLRIVTAREGVRIGLNEVALGLKFPPVTLAMCRRRVSGPALQRAILESALYDAKTAQRLGLVDEIGEEADARAMLEKLAAYPRAVYAETKRALAGTLDVHADDLRRFREETIPYWCSAEIKERARSALTKR